MDRSRPANRLPVAAVLLALLLVPASVASDAIDEEIRLAVGTQDIPGQARTLARLAWGDGDNHVLSARAREILVKFGKHGMEQIAEALLWAEPEKGADIMWAVVEAERRMTFGTSSATSLAIDHCIWFGSPDAKRIALRHLSGRPVRMLMLPVIDVAYEYPHLTPLVIETLTAIGDDRARFFLAERMEQGDPELRVKVAEAMSRIGGECLQYLRAWALSDESELRRISLTALLPATTVGDLSTLYEYFGLFPDDDPTLLAALRERAEFLEASFEAQQALDSASPPIDD